MEYLFLITLIALLFIAGVFIGNQTDADGFYILYDNVKVAEYRFSDNAFNVKSGYEAHFAHNGDEILFYPDAQDKNEYNVIAVLPAEKTVYVKEATCAGRDCTAQKIVGGKGFIYCAPHKLKITPMGEQIPVTG